MPENQYDGSSPGQELTAPENEQSWYQQEVPHDHLVKGFQAYIRNQQHVYNDIRAPHERAVLPPVDIIRKKLDLQSQAQDIEEKEFFSTLRRAFDATAYDHYEPGSLAENLAGSTLSMYYGATRETSIHLPKPIQVQMLDALTEAVGIPHKKGQTDIVIPEKLRDYTKHVMSPEHHERVAQAQAKRRR